MIVIVGSATVLVALAEGSGAVNGRVAGDAGTHSRLVR